MRRPLATALPIGAGAGGSDMGGDSAEGVTASGNDATQDRDREVADLTMVWNVLDFGVSYISA